MYPRKPQLRLDGKLWSPSDSTTGTRNLGSSIFFGRSILFKPFCKWMLKSKTKLSTYTAWSAVPLVRTPPPREPKRRNGEAPKWLPETTSVATSCSQNSGPTVRARLIPAPQVDYHSCVSTYIIPASSDYDLCILFGFKIAHLISTMKWFGVTIVDIWLFRYKLGDLVFVPTYGPVKGPRHIIYKAFWAKLPKEFVGNTRLLYEVEIHHF